MRDCSGKPTMPYLRDEDLERKARPAQAGYATLFVFYNNLLKPTASNIPVGGAIK